MYGYIEHDERLNECGVAIKSKNDYEEIDLLKGIPHKKGEELIIKLVETPDGHYLIGVSACDSNEGMGFAPSISGVAYASRENAIYAAADHIKRFIACNARYMDIVSNLKKAAREEEQLELF